MTLWKKPTFVELCMNAEIGAYQEDSGEEREPPLSFPDSAASATPDLRTSLSESTSEHVA